MVGCDKCTRWFHMSCAQVNVDDYWRCPKCKKNKCLLTTDVLLSQVKKTFHCIDID